MPGKKNHALIFYNAFKKFSDPNRIFCTFFKKCDQSPDGFSNFFRSGENQGIVQLDRKYDQYNLCQGSRIVKVNLTVINALLDDLGQSGFQLTDQMFEILMVEKGFSLSAFCFSGGILLQKMVKMFLRKNWKTRSVNIVWCRKFW